MATALKDSFPFDIARELAAAVSRHEPAFPAALFLERAGEGWDDLELMARGERIADALWAAASLPYPRLVGILVREMGPELERTEDNGMAPFRHLPVSYLIARRGSVQSWAKTSEPPSPRCSPASAATSTPVARRGSTPSSTSWAPCG